jgi:hypothetical protein
MLCSHFPNYTEAKMNKNNLSKLAQVLLPAFAVALFASPLAAGDDNRECECSNATLNGSYGLHATGISIGVGDFAAVGRFTFDGKGNLTAGY